MKQLLGKSPSGLFATQTLTGHVIRGTVAFALLYLAIGKQHLQPVAWLLAGLLALAQRRVELSPLDIRASEAQSGERVKERRHECLLCTATSAGGVDRTAAYDRHRASSR